MSQRSFHHLPSGLSVLTGWDRPLQHLFLVVEREGDDGLGPETVWSNLQLQRPMQAVEEVRAHLAAFTIPLPEDVAQGLEADKAANVGNLVVKHGTYPRTA